jgi:hypothetical protein
MDNRGRLQYDSHAGGETRGENVPGVGQRKILGTHRKPRTGRYRKWKWHLHLDQKKIRSPTNSLQT